MADKPSPTDARTYYHKGNNLFESGDFDKAIENYNMAIILNPTFSEAYFNRGLSYYNLKNFDKSISDYTKATELDPKNPVIFNNRGDAYYRKQDFQNAIVDYDKALVINKKYLKAFYNRGLAYACLQDYEKAVDDFTQVVGLNPEFAEAFHIRGLAYDYMNNLEKAIADYEQALKLNPGMTEAKSHLEIAKAKKDSGYTPPSPGSVGGPDASAGSGSPGGGPGQQGGPSVNPIKLMSKPNMTCKNGAGMDRGKEESRDCRQRALVDHGHCLRLLVVDRRVIWPRNRAHHTSAKVGAKGRGSWRSRGSSRWSWRRSWQQRQRRAFWNDRHRQRLTRRRWHADEHDGGNDRRGERPAHIDC